MAEPTAPAGVPLSTSSPSAPPAPPSSDPGPAVVIEADTTDTDADSSLGDAESVLSSTASISSTIMRYREENGRTYHAYKDGKYVMPNDDPEKDRLDLQHHLFLLTFDDKLYLSPAGSDGGRPFHHVLDVGTGTGLWALDFADEHPEASVIGVDLSPIQPSLLPPNLQFQVDDLEEPWTFTHKFDFIYSRMMTASFADWPRFFAQSFAALEPGGWLELADILPVTSDDGTMPEDSSIKKWVDLLLQGTEVIGRSFNGAVKYKEQLEAAGFVNVEQRVFKWPQNRWPKDPRYKELGSWTLENITSGLEGLSAAVYTRVLGWDKTELDVLLAQVRNDMKNKAIHAYWPIYVVYGQKPESAV